MPRILVACTLLFLIALSSFSQTTKRVPQDYATIQAAINAAVNGDTVLVDEGTYLVNLVLTKKIVLASRFLVDGDTSHISKTILDGSTPRHADSAAVITIDGATDTSTVVCGFSVTKGQGNRRYNSGTGTIGWWRVGTGIDVTAGGARISHNRVIQNNTTVAGTDILSAALHVWDIKDPNGISYVILESNLVADNVLVGQSVESAGIVVAHPARLVGNTVVRNTNGSLNVRGLGGGMSICGSPVLIDRNLIADNRVTVGSGGGVVIYWGSNVYLSNNIITGNTVGSGLTGSGRGGGLYVFQSGSTALVNNTICNNEADSGKACYIASTGTIRALNTIFASVAGASPIANRSSTCAFDHCLTTSGTLGTNGVTGDPLFVVGDTLYRLQNTSPCIGTGAASASVGSAMLYAPTLDFLGTARPRGTGTNPDMGAVENDLPVAVDVGDGLDVPNSFALSQNFPNPFNPSTTIRFALPLESNVRLTIFNLLGQKVEELVNERLTPGVKQVTWDTKVPTGVYLYRLDVVGTDGERYTETRRMTVLK